MKYHCYGKRFAILSRTLTLFTILTPVFAQAQSGDYEALSRRLALLEQRQAALEAENQFLRKQIGRLTPANSVASGTALIQQASLPLAPPAQAPAARAAETPPQRVEFGGEVRWRPESRSSFNATTNVNTFVLQRARLNVRYRLSDRVSGLIQVQDARLWGQEASTASNESNVDLHQGYLQVDRFLDPHMSLRLGRQELIYGRERLVGAFGWDNIGRSFDAVKLTASSPLVSSDFFFGRLNDRRNAGRGDGSQDLIGLYTRIGKSSAAYGVEPYVLYLRDGLATAGEQTTSRPAPTRIVTLGFRAFGGKTAGFGYDLENAYQFGQKGPDTHRAAALAAIGRYRFGGRRAPELGFEYDFATGDANSKDGKSGEFNNLFPTNHPHYGYADYLGWRNMQDFKPYLSLALRANVRAEISYHRFLLVEKAGPWKNAGGTVLGFDPTGKLGTDLGHEIDLTVAFPLYEHLRLLPGYSLFLPGKFARGTQGSRASQFAYWQTVVTF